MKHNLTLFILLVFSVNIIYASNNIRNDQLEGYVILDNGSRLDGEIVLAGVIESEISIEFLRKGKKYIYTTKDLQAYAYKSKEIDETGELVEEWVYFERQIADIPPRPFTSNLVFMQKETQGSIELFSYFIETPNQANNPLRYFYYIKTPDGKFNKVDRISFSQVSKELFNDYTALYSRIEQGDYSYRNLNQIIEDYNYWLVNQHNKDEYRMAMKMPDQQEDESFENSKTDYTEW